MKTVLKTHLLIINIMDRKYETLAGVSNRPFSAKKKNSRFVSLRTNRQNIRAVQRWRQLPVFVVLSVTSSTGKRQRLVYALQVFLPMTISINKGVNDHRQKTGNKSGEQTSPFLFPDPTFGSAKAKDGGNCLPLRVNPDVLPTCFG
jgi:hypothetical protein